MKENIDDNKCSLNDKGIAALQDGDWNRARVAFEAARHADQNIGALWNNLGYTYLQLGEYERAKNALERSISLGDIELDAWCNIAQLYEQMGVTCSPILGPSLT